MASTFANSQFVAPPSNNSGRVNLCCLFSRDKSDGTVTIPVSQDHYEDGVYRTNYYQGQEQDGAMRIPIKFKIQEQNTAKANKLRVTREIKRAGSMRRKRRAAGSRAYIVGARYYSGNLMLKSADGYHAQGNQREIVLRQQQDSSKVCLSWSHSLTARHAYWHVGQQQRSPTAICLWPAFGLRSSCGLNLSFPSL